MEAWPHSLCARSPRPLHAVVKLPALKAAVPPQPVRALVTRAHFDAEVGPRGALIVGGPEEVIDRIRHQDDVLGSITRLTFQMDLAALPHATVMRATELLGTRVASALLDRLRAGSMPCDGAWPEERVDVFQRWIDSGMPA